MKIQSILNILVLIIIITFTSCEGVVVEKKQKGSDGHKLIAQTDIPKEEKIVSLKETISDDIAFTKLNEIVQSSEYAMTFNGNTPYTVLAPLDGAFRKLPEGTVANLLKLENKEDAVALMNCHIISGEINEQDIIKAINDNNGSVKLNTLSGSRLIASRKRGKIYLIDENGNAGRLMRTDIKATNGIIHTLETVMLPKK